MPDTTNRPTPADIICHHTANLDSTGEVNALWTEDVLEDLAEYGYVIVHPDDVPVKDEPGLEAFPEADSMQMGWNQCRAHIFGTTDA